MMAKFAGALVGGRDVVGNSAAGASAAGGAEKDGGTNGGEKGAKAHALEDGEEDASDRGAPGPKIGGVFRS